MSAHNPGSAKGFTLPELLVVIAVILVVMTILVPRLEHTRKRANETSAISSLRILGQREGEYNAMFPTEGYACSLAALGGKPGAGQPRPDAAQLIPDDLASGRKGGYIISISSCKTTSLHGHRMNDGFLLTAIPETVGRSGDRGFCLDERDPIRFDPNGGANCTEVLH
jgi:type IV pilus assembly protein PilA